jgi:hypothetical protein
MWGALSDKGQVHRLRLLLALARAVILGSKSHGTLAEIFYCLRFETSVSSPRTTRRATVEVFDPASTRDPDYSQLNFSIYPPCLGRTGNTVSNKTPIIVCLPIRYLETVSYIVACVFISARTCLPSLCLAMNYAGFEVPCHIIVTLYYALLALLFKLSFFDSGPRTVILLTRKTTASFCNGLFLII